MKTKYCAIFFALSTSQVFAESKIENLKKFYEEGNYQEAQEIIKEILVEEETEIQEQDQQNFSEDPNENHEEESNEDEEEDGDEKSNEEQIEEKLFALFFDGLIHFKLNEVEKSEESFSKIIELKSDWEQISEVYFWLGYINFLQKKFSIGLDFLNLIKEKTFSNEIDNLIQYSFSGEVDDLELNRCVCKNPENNFIAKKWLNRQMQLSFADQYIWLLQYFFSKKEYQSYKKYFFNKVKINNKDKYNLAILLPLDLENNPKNSRFYDFHNLFSLAIEDCPDKERFRVFVYDTKRSSEGFEDVLQFDELKNMDAIINVSKKNLAMVSDFSRENEILLYDFSAKKLDSIRDNDFAFLTRASEETYSLGTAKFILNKIKEKRQIGNLKNVTVAFIKDDYKNAEIFKNYFSFNKIQVNEIGLTKEELRNLLYNVRVNLNTIKKEKLRKEVEEKKRQEEFMRQQEEGGEEMSNEEKQEEQVEKKEEQKETEKLEVIKILEDSDYIFLASNDIVLLGNMIGIVEQCKVNPKIFCPYELLNSELAEEIFNKENIFYITENEFGYEDNAFILFKEKYFDLYKKYPSIEMFYNYNAFQKILNNLSKQKMNLIHDEQNLMFVNF